MRVCVCVYTCEGEVLREIPIKASGLLCVSLEAPRRSARSTGGAQQRQAKQTTPITLRVCLSLSLTRCLSATLRRTVIFHAKEFEAGQAEVGDHDKLGDVCVVERDVALRRGVLMCGCVGGRGKGCCV